MTWVHTAELTSNLLLAALYAVLCIAACAARWGTTHPKTGMIKQFASVLIVGSFLRAVYLGVPDRVYGGSYTPGISPKVFSTTWGLLFLQFIIFAAANVAFFFVYVLIVYFWSSAYSSTQGDPSRKPFVMFVGFYVAYGCVQLVLLVSFCLVAYDTVLAMHSISMCIVAVCICVGYVASWRKLSVALRFPTVSELRNPAMPEWQRRLHKISLVAFFGTACWAMKICTQVYQAWILLANDGKFPGRWWWAVMLCSFFFEELFTSACILLILRKRHSSDADGNMSGVYNAGSMLSLARADTPGGADSPSSKLFTDHETTPLNSSLVSYHSVASAMSYDDLHVPHLSYNAGGDALAHFSDEDPPEQVEYGRSFTGTAFLLPP